MQKVINELIQLQELTVARAQKAASTAGTRLSHLDEAIADLIRDLPPDASAQYQRLQAKNLLVIVPVAHSVCSACGMTLPISLVQAVRQADTLYHCPSCARILYYPLAPLRGLGRRHARNEVPKMGIARFSSPGLMVPDLAADTREDAVAALCARLEAEGFVENAERLTEEALRREAIVSTAVENGLAFPHVRGVEGGGLTLTLGLSRKGLRFGDGGRILTRIVFLVVIPTAASAFYLKLLSGLVQTFKEKASRDRLLEADTPELLWKELVRATRATVR